MRVWPSTADTGVGRYNARFGRYSARFGRCLMAVVLWCAAGCATAPRMPAPLNIRADDGRTVVEFDTDQDCRPDYWQYRGADGRTRALAYADTPAGDAARSRSAGTGPGPQIELDALTPADCPHFLIILDGVPFELVAELYAEGCFRLFRPPTRVVSCFPSMTDLALSEMFHSAPPSGFEAKYYDRATGRLSDGNAEYLSGRAAPWLSQVDYRASTWWDVKVYLDPRAVFEHELAGIYRTFADVQTGSAAGYSVGTAGLGTRGGRKAILDYLREVDRVCERLVFERRGRVKLTVTADHGQNLVRNERVSFTPTLRAAGYRVGDRLHGPRDVVEISYGLVTYAAFYTADPAGVAAALVPHGDVEFACYPEDGAVVVLGRAGRAHVRKTEAGYVYEMQGAAPLSEGDPLRLGLVIDELRQAGHVSPAGEIDDAALFAATAAHDYPDPLARLWRAFHGLATNPPDVIVNLRDGACHGSAFFAAMIGPPASTHGNLNQRSSTTFALTMLGELPAALRTADLLPALERLRQPTSAP